MLSVVTQIGSFSFFLKSNELLDLDVVRLILYYFAFSS